MTFIVVTLASWRVSRLNIVSAIRDLPEASAEARRSWLNRIWSWGIGVVLAIGGVYILQLGLQQALPGVLLVGATLLGAYLFALLTTIVPAYQAAKVYPAEALRYKG